MCVSIGLQYYTYVVYVRTFPLSLVCAASPKVSPKVSPVGNKDLGSDGMSSATEDDR